ncbi:hypothetical protein GCM10023191_005680 [Actinoallomurus oryzae]|uniref:Uncharacterized protein n=1 Tax=Actinoallomurus oryzae TaxID=502180 RepID=A0ABP8P8C5_9ACTN
METALISACAGFAGVIIGAFFQHFLTKRRTSVDELRKHSRAAAEKLIEKLLQLTHDSELARTPPGFIAYRGPDMNAESLSELKPTQTIQLSEIAALQKQLLDRHLRARVALTVDIMTEPAVRTMFEELGYPEALTALDTIAIGFAIECLASYLRGEKEPRETPEYAMGRVVVEKVKEQAAKHMSEELKRIGEQLRLLSEGDRREAAEIHLGLRGPEGESS